MSNIPDKLTAQDIRNAAARLDAGEAHPFGQLTEYEAIIDGRRYAPKAVIGLAAGLGPADFSGGEAPGQANWYLRRLGFEVVSKHTAVGEDWTDDEIWVAIDGYFAMLFSRLRGEKFVKAERLREMAARTHGRSPKSVEYKLQNISAVLMDIGLTRLDGFAPASNYQARLAVLVEQYLESRPEVVTDLRSSLDALPPPVSAASVPARDSIKDDPPVAGPDDRDHGRAQPRARLMDAAARDAINRNLGKAGEAFVFALEQAELVRRGRPDLAAQVRWVARDDGDGLGYDIRSFEPSADEIWIEVKTTNGAKETPFYLTANEIEVSTANPEKYRLYRLFNMAAEPRLYVLVGNLAERLKLKPVVFRATP